MFVNIGAFLALVHSIEIYMDATFRTPPTGFYQLASLHAISNTTVIGLILNDNKFE